MPFDYTTQAARTTGTSRFTTTTAGAPCAVTTGTWTTPRWPADRLGWAPPDTCTQPRSTWQRFIPSWIVWSAKEMRRGLTSVAAAVTADGRVATRRLPPLLVRSQTAKQ